jgi:hypothetical protein
MAASPSLSVIERLLELEEGFWKAAGNGDYYREHMASDGLCVLPVGVLDREETAAAIDESEPWAEFEIHDVTALDLGDDEAALCYRAEAFRDDPSHGYTALISSVYTRLSGEWKLNLHQQTPIEES